MILTGGEEIAQIYPVTDSGSTPDFIFPLESVSGSQAASRLAALRKEFAGTGHVPVILGHGESVALLMETREFNSEGTVLPGAMDGDAGEWFGARVASDPEAYETLEDDEFYPDGAAPMQSLSVGQDHRGKERPQIWIAKVDAANSWELPLKLAYGSWNGCPSPEEHAKIARYWGERYGAEIAVMTSDTVEFTVARPPETKEARDELAREMFIYCPDIVDQGVGSVPTLSKCLEGSTVWFFWWD
jgi:hypothetical protein